MKTIQAADIGGMNSRFAHFEIDQHRALNIVAAKWLPTAVAESFSHFLDQLRTSDFSLSPSQADIVKIVPLSAFKNAPPQKKPSVSG